MAPTTTSHGHAGGGAGRVDKGEDGLSETARLGAGIGVIAGADGGVVGGMLTLTVGELLVLTGAATGTAGGAFELLVTGWARGGVATEVVGGRTA